MNVNAIIVGMRKAGTTWLYENFRADPMFRVSDKVKESGFFTGETALSSKQYDDLLMQTNGIGVEVDASVCYSAHCGERIDAYNADMKVVLVVRDPVDYLASRMIHSFRKGEIQTMDPEVALAEYRWLLDELDYRTIEHRFAKQKVQSRLLVKCYDDLVDDCSGFYSSIRKFLTAGVEDLAQSHFEPSRERVNISRQSAAGFIPSLLSNLAKMARRYRLHALVNAAKSSGIHGKLEKATPASERAVLNESCRKALEGIQSDAISYYADLKGRRFQTENRE